MKSFSHSLVVLAGAFLVAGAGAAFAQGGGGRGMTERFQMLDINGDGQVSAEEAAEWHETVFVTMDADDDQQLTREEYMAIQLGQGADPDQRGPRFAEKQADKDARFTMMDADGDGFVTKDQFLADGQSSFEASDTDKNGAVSMPEFIAARWM